MITSERTRACGEIQLPRLEPISRKTPENYRAGTLERLDGGQSTVYYTDKYLPQRLLVNFYRQQLLTNFYRQRLQANFYRQWLTDQFLPACNFYRQRVPNNFYRQWLTDQFLPAATGHFLPAAVQENITELCHR